MFRSKKNRLILLPLSALLLVLLILARRQSLDSDGVPILQKLSDEGRYGAGFETMGTEAFVLFYADNMAEARDYFASAKSPIVGVNKSMSLYDERSELSRLNRLKAGEKMQISPELYDVIGRSVHYADLSNGAFDPTFTPLKHVWRKAQNEGSLPDEAVIQQALDRVGIGAVELLENNYIRVNSEVEFDLGGIAKGYAADLAVQALQKRGCRHALVDIGGDIAVLGARKDGTPWRIGVQSPFGKYLEEITLQIKDMAVTTSGDYARYYRIADRKFSHIIDPRTGFPVSDVPSVTLIAETAVSADALATAVNVLGAEAGRELVDALENVECMIIMRKGENEGGKEQEIEIYYSENFHDFIAE